LSVPTIVSWMRAATMLSSTRLGDHQRRVKLTSEVALLSITTTPLYPTRHTSRPPASPTRRPCRRPSTRHDEIINDPLPMQAPQHPGTRQKEKVLTSRQNGIGCFRSAEGGSSRYTMTSDLVLIRWLLLSCDTCCNHAIYEVI